MKKLLTLPLIIFLLSSCESELTDKTLESENAEVLGSWKLIEELWDPGDGSGVYQTTTRDLVITFYTDQTFSTNNSLCSYYENDPVSGSGIVDADENKIYPEECQPENGEGEFALWYELTETNLFLYYMCIEPCGLKFEKLK